MPLERPHRLLCGRLHPQLDFARGQRDYVEGILHREAQVPTHRPSRLCHASIKQRVSLTSHYFQATLFPDCKEYLGLLSI